MLNKFIDYFALYNHSSVNTKISIINEVVNVDLSNPCNHLGDTILFAPLIAGLIEAGYSVRVSDNYSMYKKLFGLDPVDSDGFFIGRSYSADERKRIGAGLINFYSLPALPIAEAIHNKFLPSSSYNSSLNIVKNRLKDLSTPMSGTSSIGIDKKFVLVSPGINSRAFGFFPNSKKTKIDFIKAVSIYKQNNFLVIKIGQKSADLNSFDKGLTSNIDLDISGNTQWYELPSLIMHQQFHSIVTYDTFTYHLAVLLDSKCDLFSKSWLTKCEYMWISERFTPGF